ncbi:DUF2752 domain-containing protein [Chitinophaga horti]|uniref:DUF2752 domain-containing protein n=1 Tax=Chitinophaga horti TaxID=2920382 RepID=A0ABY6IZW3_9BACT|nr:DUF2752 domain-containing protein [Chitinophaga horti]UYQ92716.1 DUF2752 domain-containing protein [Chitinophaga horti]
MLVARGHIKKINIELWAWAGALIVLLLIDPSKPPLFNLCPLHFLGIEWCPGCGLGRSISYLLHGEVVRSWKTHKLGGFVLVLLIARVIQLAKIQYIQHTTTDKTHEH